MGIQADPAIIATAPSPQDTAPPAAPVKACPVRLSAGLTLEEAFQAILDNCLEQIEANRAGVLAQDTECLHQMRVGLRRLRAALDLFKRQVQLPDALQRDLDWVSALLGKARDWDVFISDTLGQVAPGDGSWDGCRQTLLVGAAGHAAAAHKAAQRALRSRRYKLLATALAGWAGGRQWRQPLDGVRPGRLEQPVRKGMRPLLDKARRRLHKRLRQADQADAADLHRIRIAAKKSRYAAEFFQSLLPARALKEELRRLKTLQDVLGGLNDLATADALLAQLQQAEATRLPAAYARGYLAAVGAGKTQAVGRIGEA